MLCICCSDFFLWILPLTVTDDWIVVTLVFMNMLLSCWWVPYCYAFPYLHHHHETCMVFCCLSSAIQFPSSGLNKVSSIVSHLPFWSCFFFPFLCWTVDFSRTQLVRDWSWLLEPNLTFFGSKKVTDLLHCNTTTSWDMWSVSPVLSWGP